jgi:zinc/manganese transport system substrate-binding protein
VAAENFWGSVASQIGGAHARVVSIIANPDIDPHSYEPTVADALALARARMVVENGVGYDPWVAHLVAADDPAPAVLDVGHLLGVPDGGNPHRWYNPTDVHRVVDAVTTAYQRLDPADRAYFAARRATFDRVALAPYDAAIRSIRARHAGTPVGASESIFAMLAPALRLDLVTPPTFLRAVSEGTDVSSADVESIDRQIAHHRIDLYVFNSQNLTPDVQSQVAAARRAGIPVVSITETLEPANITFEAWQTRQLQSIEAALIRADRRR